MKMKTTPFFILLLICCAITFNGCREYVSLTNATKVSQLTGNPFIYNLSKSMMKNTAKFMIEKGIKSAVSKVNLLTPLSAVITNPSHIGDYTSMLSSVYKIPGSKLSKAYSSLSSVKDLIYFVANNGQKFNFYS